MVKPAFEDPTLAPSLELKKGRPKPVQDLVDQLTILIGDRYVVRVGSPKEMYPEEVVEAIPYSELLQLFLNDWLDVSLLHWFAIGHWSLMILHPASYRGYIVDSMRTGKTKRSYTPVSIINKVFGKRYFKWEMVQQQEDTWECGYIVIKHIKEFVEHIQYDIVKEASFCICIVYCAKLYAVSTDWDAWFEVIG
ncbi:putative Ulp1 protease family catalytic domain, papain-like cysteine peptidase superfamily [Helianthus anomalus]